MRIRMGYLLDVHREREIYDGQIGEIGRAIVGVLEDDDQLEGDLRESAQQALQVLIGVYGYERSSAKAAIGALVDARYHD